MKRKNRRYQIVACILAFLIALTNCYVPEAFAATKDNKTVQVKEEKVQRGKVIARQISLLSIGMLRRGAR